MASATLGRFTGDASDGTSSVGVKASDQPPSASSVFTARRLPPRIGEPSRRAHTPGGKNDCSGTAAPSSATPMTTGSSAAATAWRTFFREKGTFSVWNAR